MDRNDALLKILEIAWQDIWRMRDQSWTSLNYAMVVCGGLLGLGLKEPKSDFLLPACIALGVITAGGFAIGWRHAGSQKKKLGEVMAIEQVLLNKDDKKESQELAKVRKCYENSQPHSVVAWMIASIHGAMCIGSVLLFLHLRGVL